MTLRISAVRVACGAALPVRLCTRYCHRSASQLSPRTRHAPLCCPGQARQHGQLPERPDQVAAQPGPARTCGQAGRRLEAVRQRRGRTSICESARTSPCSRLRVLGVRWALGWGVNHARERMPARTCPEAVGAPVGQQAGGRKNLLCPHIFSMPWRHNLRDNPRLRLPERLPMPAGSLAPHRFRRCSH